eukprot:scaffold133_cov257-Pinguiococcus_pyrenoidosus.AAC.7
MPRDSGVCRDLPNQKLVLSANATGGCSWGAEARLKKTGRRRKTQQQTANERRGPLLFPTS